MPVKNRKNVVRGSGNVFADLGLEQPEEILAKAQIVEAIGDILQDRGLTQQEAAKAVGLTQPQISRLTRGDTREFSYERLLRVLVALGQDVEITIRRASSRAKHGRVLVHT